MGIIINSGINPQVLGLPGIQIRSGGALVVGPPPWYLSGGISSADCLAAYRAKGAASLAASYVNLNNPGTNDAAPGVAPTWAAGTGWTFNGTTQYLTTGLTEDMNFLSAFIQFNNRSGADNVMFGTCNNAFGGIGILPSRFGNRRYFHDAGALDVAAAAAGNAGIAGQTGYFNGASDGAIPSGVPSNLIVVIGCGGGAAAPAFFCDVDVVAFAAYKITLSAGQASALATAMAAL